MSDWFISDKGQTLGPLATSLVVDKVVSGELSDSALVWREGMPQWQPLLIHFKRPGPIVTARQPNFFLRFWRGDYPLAVSYWIVGFLGTILIAIAAIIILIIQRDLDYDPYWFFARLGGIWLVAAAWGVFQFVGTWRSAVSYRRQQAVRQKSGLWGIAAQIAIAAGTVASAAAIVTHGAPQLSEAWGMAFSDDPSVPDYKLRVMRGGSELEVTGGIKFGLTNSVGKTLQAFPAIQVVHLSSDGGRIGEALKLRRLIAIRGLSTYVSSECLSACTIAFAGGRERWLKTGAKLGYHGARFAGRDYAEAMRTALLKAGLPASFAARAVSVTSDDMWYPAVDELKAAAVITGTVDTYRFAASGYVQAPGSDGFKDELRRISFYRTIEVAEPAVLAAMVAAFEKGHAGGLSEGQILDTIRETYIRPLVSARLATADDGLAAEYAALLADQYEAAGQKSGRACFQFAVNGQSPGFGGEFSEREVVLTEKLILMPPVRTTVSPADIQAIYDKLGQQLSARFGAAVQLLDDAAKVQPAQYELYCSVITDLYRGISRLPAPQAGNVMRDMFGRLAAPPAK